MSIWSLNEIAIFRTSAKLKYLIFEYIFAPETKASVL